MLFVERCDLLLFPLPCVFVCAFFIARIQLCCSANWPYGCRVSTLIISTCIGLLSPSSPSLSWTITYLLTPCSRVLLEKLTGFQLVKKFPTFYGTRRFITTFTSARHLSLSSASSILLRSYQSIRPGPRISVWMFRNNIRFTVRSC